jgi:undecaprenyl-phosphate 4-deoxy-4-formamido-L-arabinose transferase
MDVSIVVTVLNEERSVEELHRRIAASLEGRDWEAIFVDDGSTDGTFAALRAIHERDPRVRVVRFKRNFGQHPAMHAGLARARGDRIVTMDGDLQNEPEDIPRLLETLDRVDVASGRRVARLDSAGRTLPSRVINGLLRSFTGVEISDFGCAFNGYRRDAIEPVMHRIGRQKFTKALVCATGARVTEVDLGHAARDGRSRYSAFKLVKLALHVLTGFWAQMVQWVGAVLAIGGILTSVVVTTWGLVFWVRHGNFPGPLLLGGLVLFVLGLQGFLMAVLGEHLTRIQRDIEQRPIYYIVREIG